MAMALRHMGEFLSRKGVVWRVEILQDNYSGNVGQLTFEADEALVINWKHTDKEEVICGSEATLKIESPGDRTYEDLYTIEVGKIRMDVYRENSLYWSGTLDPEFYEEPYEKARYYVVTLTFSDFGILDRLKYNLSGMQTLEAILLDAIDRSKVCASLLANSYCTTYFAGTNTKATLSALSMRSENFYDEDAEPSTLKEVVTGILQPLAMKMIQRNGHIYIFDLNGLYTLAQSRAITWDGDSQTMGVDKVANNVKVNFSPYSSSELLSGKLEYKDTYSADMINLVADPGASYYSYYPDYSEDHRQGGNWDYNLINFTIFISTLGAGLHYLNPMARYCHILPLVGGPSETTAIAWAFHSGGHGGLNTGWPKRILNDVRMEAARQIMQTHRVFLPKLTTEDAKSYYVRLSLEMLLDARYNPFTEGNDGNEGGNYEGMKGRTGYAFVPVAVNIYDSAGNAVCHYENSTIAKGATKGHLGYCKGSWVSGAGGFGTAYLEYYDPKDLWESAGILGWKANRHCIGRPGRGNIGVQIYDSFKQMADGQYMPYPPEGGYIEVTVYEGVQCFDMDEVRGMIPQQTPWDSPRYWIDDNRYNQCRWLLYKAPKIELVKNNLIFDAAELDDVEYSGYINKHAKEEISIDTVCGTANTTCPTAKGIYCRASDSLQIQQLKRAGVTDHPEKLLIGTLYSQYATRHTTLEGEAVIDPGGLCKYTEQNQPGKVFMMSEEQQDVITDTTQAVYTELSPDEYDAIEEVNN
jgi:hypothetical protein